jgi:hypothetical protein
MANVEEIKNWLKSNLPRLLRNVVVAAAFAAATRSGLSLYLRTLWPILTSFFHVWWLTALGTIAVLLIGTVLFFFKKYAQTYYGLGEIGFASNGRMDKHYESPNYRRNVLGSDSWRGLSSRPRLEQLRGWAKAKPSGVCLAHHARNGALTNRNNLE